MHSYSVIAHDNDIYITGGHSSNQCTVDIVSGKLLFFILKTCKILHLVYQSRYQKWIRLKSMNQARERHGSACVDGHIYVVGGLMAGKESGRILFNFQFWVFLYKTSIKAEAETGRAEWCWAVQPNETDVGTGEKLTKKMLLSRGY